MTTVKSALFPYIHTLPLLNGEVTIPGIELDNRDMHEASPPAIFREMTREHPWGISEMSIMIAISKKDFDLPFTAIPVFTVRRFDYANVFYNVNSGIREPKDLEGKRVATGALYTDPDIHSEGMLAEVYGVDLSTIHWVAIRDFHITAVKFPANVELSPHDSVNEMIESGEVDATVGGYNGNSPDVKRLLPDTSEAEQHWRSRNHFNSIHHTIGIANDLLAEDPTLAERVYNAFVQAKQPFLTRLANNEDLWEELNGSVLGARHDFGIQSQSELLRPDPIPYGIEQNRGVLEAVVRYGHNLGYLSREWPLEELFATPGSAND